MKTISVTSVQNRTYSACG